MKSFMLVKSDGKEAKYAEWLSQLIGKMSSFESSQPITEDDYKTSSSTIDNIPSGKVIFFGNGKEATTQGKSINWQYDHYGMRYGWLGNRCVITADPNKVSLKEQSTFAEYYNSRIEELRPKLKALQIEQPEPIYFSKTETVDDSDLDDELRWHHTDDAVERIGKTTATVILGAPILLLKAMKGAVNTAENVRATFERKNLWECQYKLLVYEYLVNGLQKFMEENTEKNYGRKKVIIVHAVKDSEYAHLLNNLIQQYSKYEVAEFTEKMFLDNAKGLHIKSKIIFLGKTKSYKERWIDGIGKYTYNEEGMHYGWNGNQAFISVRALKKSERNAFIELYRKKSKEYEDKAKDYAENRDFNIGKKVAKRFNMAGAVSLFVLPNLLGFAVRAGINYGLGAAVDKAKNNATTIANLSGYQYQLLLREFVFNGLKEFMEEA